MQELRPEQTVSLGLRKLGSGDRVEEEVEGQVGWRDWEFSGPESACAYTSLSP